jgi:hypothetical protein
MQRYKLLISLALLGFSSYIFYHRFSHEFIPVSASVTQSHKMYIKTPSYRPGKYRYTFEYEYTYQEKTYVSDRYTYGGRNTSEGVCKYQIGDTLTAYVDVKNPAYSVIKRDVSVFVYGVAVAGVLMLIQILLTSMIERQTAETPEGLQKAHNLLSAMIGVTVLFGGIGYLSTS